jgi:hypothetical protein
VSDSEAPRLFHVERSFEGRLRDVGSALFNAPVFRGHSVTRSPATSVGCLIGTFVSGVRPGCIATIRPRSAPAADGDRPEHAADNHPASDTSEEPS